MSGFGEEEVGTRTRRGFAVATVGAGLLASVALVLSLTGTLSAFVASIANTANTAGTGALVMQETNADGSIVCNSTDAGGGSNAATCSTINKYGGDLAMVPGQSIPTTVEIINTGTVPASTFMLTPGPCTQSANGAAPGTATDLCAKMDVTITEDGSTAFTGTLASLAAAGSVALTSPVTAAQSVTFVFTVTLDSSADASYQGLQVSQPLSWTFTS